MTPKTINCIGCGSPFDRRSHRHVRCDRCSPIHRRMAVLVHNRVYSKQRAARAAVRVRGLEYDRITDDQREWIAESLCRRFPDLDFLFGFLHHPTKGLKQPFARIYYAETGI